MRVENNEEQRLKELVDQLKTRNGRLLYRALVKLHDKGTDTRGLAQLAARHANRTVRRVFNQCAEPEVRDLIERLLNHPDLRAT